MIKNLTKRIAAIIKVLSYVFLLLQWVWVIVLYSSLVVETDIIQTYIDTAQTAEPQEPTGVELPEFIRQPFAAVIFIAMLALSVVLLIRAPKKATEVTIRATKVTAKSITPTVQKFAHVPKKQQRQLNEMVLLGMIVSLSVLAGTLTIPVMHSISLSASVIGSVSITLCMLTIGTVMVSGLLGYVSRDRTR
jgi:hypothetical protein